MEEVRYTLMAVAFVRSVGGRVRLLVSVDGEAPLFDGEPVLLVEHRPGAAAADLVVEPSDQVAASVSHLVVERAGIALVELVEQAFDGTGQFVGERLLGTTVELSAPADAFDQKSDDEP